MASGLLAGEGGFGLLFSSQGSIGSLGSAIEGDLSSSAGVGSGNDVALGKTFWSPLAPPAGLAPAFGDEKKGDFGLTSPGAGAWDGVCAQAEPTARLPKSANVAIGDLLDDPLP